MPRFFVESDSINDGIVTLSGENARHISFSLRMKPGEHITVCDGEGRVSECEITDIDSSKVSARIVEVLRDNGEPPYRAVLCQAIAKGDKMDTIIQKAVELGVYRVIPFESKNCVARIKPEARAKKTERFRNIAKAAAKQCGRGIIPQIDEPCTFDDIMKIRDGERIFCYECSDTPLGGHLEGDLIYFLIGPEGGFSPSEAELAIENGWQSVSLGKRILRTETASAYFLCALSYERENKRKR